MSHRHISWLKSALRVVGYILIPLSLWDAVVVLIISEALGVVEEIGH